MKQLLSFLLVMFCTACATAGKTTLHQSDFASEAIYGVEESAPPTSETVSLGDCQYSVPVEDFTSRVSGQGIARDFDFQGAQVSVRLIRVGAKLNEALTAVYRREVNGLDAPFYGYPTGPIVRDDVSATYGFVVRNVNTPEVLGTTGFTQLRMDPQSGRILVFTATWAFTTTDFAYEPQLHDLADHQFLSCS
jgi:hypothetical protein